MLKALQKALGGKEAVKPVETLELKLDTAEIQAAIKVAVDAASAEFAEFKQTAEALLADSEATIATLTSQAEGLGAKVAELTAALEAANADKVKAAADALATKLASRKEKLVASIGTERADALLKVTEGMEDAAFEAVVSALGVSASVEAAAPMFTEVGADAQADGTQVVESAEMKILREKYHGKK